MKQIIKEKLQQDLVRICKQIGILPNEVPKLIFNPREMNKILISRSCCPFTFTRREYRRLSGLCIFQIRTVFVNENSRGLDYQIYWNREGKLTGVGSIKKLVMNFIIEH